MDPQDFDEVCTYLKDCLNRIDMLCNSLHDGQCRMFKKILLFSFLDGLSTSIIPKGAGHIDKMRKLISEFGCWAGANRVSLPHLCQWISLKPESMEEERRNYYTTLLNGWSAGEIRSIDDDPDIQDVLRSIKSNSKDLRNITHAGLLSHQRHCLVHEFMHNGVNIEFSDYTHPYYLHLEPFSGNATPQEESSEAWLLIYPTGFLFRLAHRCLSQAIQYWGDKNLDPRSSYSSGYYLWPKLNRD